MSVAGPSRVRCSCRLRARRARAVHLVHLRELRPAVPHAPTAGFPSATRRTCRWSRSSGRVQRAARHAHRDDPVARAIDYPSLEILVIDNNTKDPEAWQPVEDYCHGRPRVRFVHVDPLDGFKSGALNLVLGSTRTPTPRSSASRRRLPGRPRLARETSSATSPTRRRLRADPAGLPRVRRRRLPAGLLRRVQVLLRTPMPSRNERNSIIFAGTMGLAPPLRAGRGRRLGRVVHHRGRRALAADAQGRLSRHVRRAARSATASCR